ncbi:transglycosylase domain-containing protein [Jeotgalibacillus haloalkalitolerans]|uniref:Transglycosylase domain-containing protein n=1 Tax=Jeotgalibacillus haloalkalitolerans TaxID=3104292 RepID=A0ABU5KQW9_9BACL|nr:transglycosylase domain-containing protein [Jeotgalibacillus sp. HH7-29]MDZ5713643.1 transglycosylase domain-containing protein [Jeotgalibacillus sp. HH7-29]
MRMTLGFTGVLLMIPLCIFLWVQMDKEISTQAAFQEAVSEKVNVENIHTDETSFLLDKDGNRFAQGSSGVRLYASDEEIPQFLKDVTVYSEDQNFYDHIGFDAGAIIRAVVKNLVFTHIQQGGSTITQQLARNLYLTQEKTYNRKMTELFYANELEKKLSKDEILSAYLNIIYYSNGVYGIKGASVYYFDKELNELTKAEMAFLAAIPNNPSKYDPINNFDQAKERQERLLDILVLEDMMDPEEAEALKAEPITMQQYENTDLYPDYAVYVEYELKQLIAEKEGFKDRLNRAEKASVKEQISQELDQRTNEVLGSGIMIHTALDPDLQQKTVAAVNQNLPYEGVQGAAVLIDNVSREIVGLSGGTDYQKYNFNRAYQAVRQPGSAIKPLLVYAPYIDTFQPFLSQTVNADSFCIDNYCPENYGGVEYGDVSISRAFLLSLNTPAARLMNETGIELSFNYLNAFDFDFLEPGDQTLAAASGGFTYGMSPLELTDAYTSFIDGSYTPAHAIRMVTDTSGNVLYEWEDKQIPVWSPQTTTKMRALLNTAAISGTGSPAYLNKPYIGIKTGTTNEWADYWTVGLTDRYTGGVWVGHDLPENMRSIETDRPAHLIWKDMMR